MTIAITRRVKTNKDFNQDGNVYAKRKLLLRSDLMQIKFNLEDVLTGEQKVWAYPNDEDCRIDRWRLAYQEPSKAVVNFEEFQRDDPTLASLSCLPRKRGTLKRFLDWWFNDADENERKSYVYLCNDCDYSCLGAMDTAYDVEWTGVKGDDYKGLGEYVAEELGLWKRFDNPEEAKKHFDFEGFAKSWDDPTYEISATFNEWCVVSYDIVYLGTR